MGVYRPPGVYAQEEVRNIIPSPIPSADIIAIVSEVPSATPNVERVVLNDLTAVDLNKKGALGASVKIFSRDEFTQYVAGVDFTVTSDSATDYGSTKSVARINNTVDDEALTFTNTIKSRTLANPRGVHNLVVRTVVPARTYVEYVDYVYDRYSQVLRVLPGSAIPQDGTNVLVDYNFGIASGEEVLVRYNYADADYYGHKLLNDPTEAYAAYGLPFTAQVKDVSGKVTSGGDPNPMSLAASIAFANGGPQTQILCVPVNPHAIDPAKTNPTLAEWQIAFDSIAEDGVSLVLETSGLVETQGYLISHTLGASAYRQERVAIMGRDFTKDGSGRAELRAYAEAINNQRIVLVSPSRWETQDTVNGGVRVVGGQYAAAAIAGKLTLRRVQDTLTRQGIIAVRTSAPEAEPNLTRDTASGLLVIENKGGFMRVRHAVTTMFSDVNQRELNVVRAKDFLIKSMRESLDRSVIGLLMEPDVDFLVQAAATNVLDRMRSSYVIADYTTPQVFQDYNEPTRLRLRFTYIPNYPVNEISIEFGISPLGANVS